MLRPFRQSLSLGVPFLTLWLGLSQAWAASFSDLIVFGDSLSDIGNVAQSSLGIYPGRYYYNNRFSNGPVWVEPLSVDLGLGVLSKSTAGGDDFAYGGAQTSGTGGLEGIFIRDVDEQVTQFLGARTVDPKALFVVFAGSNDFIGGQTNVDEPVSRLTTDISRLISAGARQLLVPNLPLLGMTPRYNDSPSLVLQYNGLTERFNAALDAALDGLAKSNLALNFYRLDVAALFANAVAHPDVYGLKNVTDSAAPGLEPGASSYNTSQIAPDANAYLFWDDLHPTATVHAILADRAHALLVGLPGDFDTDGVVDGEDLTAWRSGAGVIGAAVRRQGDADGDQDVDGADLLTWQRGLGADVIWPTTRPGLQSVPEPAPICAAMLLGSAAYLGLRSGGTASARLS